jgi:hypothetical protein
MSPTVPPPDRDSAGYPEVVPLENSICVVTCGSSRCQAAREYFVDQTAQDGFSVDPFAVEVDNGETATVMFAAGDALGDALCGRAVL